MKITISTVGRLKEKYWIMACDEYIKRLNKYMNIEIIQSDDEKAPENISPAECEIIKNKEGQRILKGIKKESFVITLEIEGKQMTSEEFSQLIQNSMINGISNITFVIGGSLGLSEEVKKRANIALSFSKMTFPHQLMRVVLLEQVYRAYKIIKNEPYHK